MYNTKEFEDRFDVYSKSFLGPTTKEHTSKNIKLKIAHTKNVMKNCRAIALNENLCPNDIFIAELCGLFHDVGRFEQFTRFNTFRDEDSLYHGQLGVEILIKEGFLDALLIKTQELIKTVVYNHGLIRIPEETIGQELFFSKLIRDADKIDIYRIVSNYYCNSGPRNIALEYGLIDSPIISESILNKFKAKQLIEKEELNTLNDFKTMQLAWIFDLNFEYTRKTILDKGFLDIVLESISSLEQREILRNEIRIACG